MVEKGSSSHAPPAAMGAEGSGAYDREIDLRWVLWFGVALVGTTIVVLLLMWWMSAAFKGMDEAKDHAPSPLGGEALLDPVPPGPRLQPVPPRDMDELREADRKMLTTYGWADQTRAIARIPVDRAIEILAEKGLPATAPAPETAGSEETAAPAQAGSNKPAADQPAAAHEAAPIVKPKVPHKKKEPK
jgi:hypothetical protein